ncbi:MAG: PhnD/SsuA/transferrin family substrate-binding protein [Betaproteobacteria bacterium]|nr:PhnD/SsuA/transferrin family substrate-binding protein [Betaproteobacteria bacterium]
MHRRHFLQMLSGAAAMPLTGSVHGEPATLRIGLTPVFLDDQLDFLKQLNAYFARRSGRPVSFIQRGSYREINELILGGKLDFAWICGYPYVSHRRDMRLLAVPVYHGKPLYQSYLIVPKSDSDTRYFTDLRGKIYAYSDPDSNSGFLYPQYSLLRAGENPTTFFSRTFFTWAHRKVVVAVGVGLAQGGSVDGYVYDTLALVHPELTAATRVAHRSPLFGHTPFVARHDIPERDFRSMQGILVSMRDDQEGAQLLRSLNLDGFTPGDDHLYDSIAAMARTLAESRR